MGRLCGRSNFRPKILWIMEIISVKRTFKSSGTTSNNNIGRKLTKHPDGIKTINGQDVDKITSSVIWIYFLTQREIIRKICSIAMSTSYTPFWTKTLCLCLLDGSERFYPALSLGFCMHVCTPLGISSAGLIKPIVDPISSVHCSLRNECHPDQSLSEQKGKRLRSPQHQRSTLPTWSSLMFNM